MALEAAHALGFGGVVILPGVGLGAGEESQQAQRVADVVGALGGGVGVVAGLPEPAPELEVTLVFALPSDETVSTWASPVGLRGRDVALSFENVRPDSRIAISQHVVARLTGREAGPPADPRGPGEGRSG